VKMRTHLKASKFVVVKAGTSTVSHDDGTPSLPRLGAIVEAVSQLMRQGTKVILVSSGAVGCGRSVLRKQAALHRTLRDHMKSQEVTEGAGYSAAAAAAGQLALMSLYETLFATQEIEPSQFLVTRRDFVDEACRKNLQHSIQAIMDVGMVPIINENDAVSGNAGYSEVPDGCFSDNDGLAALVAKLVGADCLIMLTDVEGLYDRPPSEAGARLVREVHPASLKDWKFGGISKGGRGGMEAKVNAALGALEVGIKSVVLASGSEKEVLQRRGRGVFFISRRLDAIDAICLTQGPRRRRRRHVLLQRHRAEAVFGRRESARGRGPKR
jgi:delta-1-pyrroline-5-carboxylate synthetase